MKITKDLSIKRILVFYNEPSDQVYFGQGRTETSKEVCISQVGDFAQGIKGQVYWSDLYGVEVVVEVQWVYIRRCERHAVEF